MIYLFIGMSLLFIGTGFIVTENNAKQLLAGYNTMSEEDRKKVNIKDYLSFFRNFHLFLGISFLLLGLLITYFFGKNVSGIFLAVYPIIAYIYFIWASSEYKIGNSTNSNKVGIIVLIATLILVTGLLGVGYKEDPLILTKEAIEFKGIYGEKLSASKIESIQLVEQLPRIKKRTNGFALGSINKGFFKTEDGTSVKLILNADNKPYLLFTKSDGKEIYFSAKKSTNEQVLDQLKSNFPDIIYK